MTTTCKYVCCNIKPKYSVEYSNLAEYYYSHAPKGYADVTVRTCIYIMCKNPATHKINKQLEFCMTHAPIDAIPGYIKCLSSECSRKATYGALDINVKEYCYKHCNRKLHVKLGRKTCKHIGCKKLAAGRQRQYCAEHLDVTYLPTINSDVLALGNICIISQNSLICEQHTIYLNSRHELSMEYNYETFAYSINVKDSNIPIVAILAI